MLAIALVVQKIIMSQMNDILQECGKQLTMTLVNYHESQIAQYTQLAEERITTGNQIVLLEYITMVTNTSVLIENAIQELLNEITVTSKRLRKRLATNCTTNKAKKLKPDNPAAITNESKSNQSNLESRKDQLQKNEE